jgi:hypothetical protein
MFDNATRRYFTLTFAMYLTLLLGLSVVTAPTPTKTVGQVVASPEIAGLDAPHTSPKRDTIVSESELVRANARIWFHQNIDGYHNEWLCIDEIIYRESRWIPNLWNSQGSTAYGLGQVKGSHHYTHNKPLKQFKVAVRVAIHKHGTLCNALAHHDQHGWY